MKKINLLGGAALFSLAIFAPLCANAQDNGPVFGDIFTDNAVLAANSEVTIRGVSKPNEILSFKLDGEAKSLLADENGYWATKISTTGKQKFDTIGIFNKDGLGQNIKNIEIGTVFLCSGQSNMEFKLKNSTNSEGEIASSGNENVWFINIPRESSISPKANYSNKPKWQKANNKNVGEASAVCYYAAREIAARMNVKVGIINASWGGSRIEPWFKRENLEKFGTFESDFKLLDEYKKDPDIAKAALIVTQYVSWDSIDKGISQDWKNPNLDDKEWREISNLQGWEQSQYNDMKDFDGIVWYRHNFELSAIDAKEIVLQLGKIDDNDEVYINNQLIGATNDWATMREYKFASDILKKGNNTLAIRVIDTGGGGGFWGNTPKTLKIGDKEIELGNMFRFKIGGALDKTKIKRIVPWGETNGLTTLYNGMIAPLSDYTISAFLWYQGESNVGEADNYEKLMTAFIQQQRTEFKNPDLPFIMTGLSAYGRLDDGTLGSEWAKLRDRQLKVSLNTKNVFLAPSLDVGDPYDIHPAQKRIIGKRMALALENVLFGKSNAIGPFPVSAIRKGKEIIVSFKDTGGGLKAISSDFAIGFIACDKSGKKCDNLIGKIDGDKAKLQGAKKSHYLIRYSWSDAPIVNLYGNNGFTVSSFELKIENDLGK